MNVLVLVLFIISVTLIVYTYIGYRALLYVLNRLFGHPIRKAEITPLIAFLKFVGGQSHLTWESLREFPSLSEQADYQMTGGK